MDQQNHPHAQGGRSQMFHRLSIVFLFLLALLSTSIPAMAQQAETSEWPGERATAVLAKFTSADAYIEYNGTNASVFTRGKGFAVILGPYEEKERGLVLRKALMNENLRIIAVPSRDRTLVTLLHDQVDMDMSNDPSPINHAYSVFVLRSSQP